MLCQVMLAHSITPLTPFQELILVQSEHSRTRELWYLYFHLSESFVALTKSDYLYLFLNFCQKYVCLKFGDCQYYYRLIN